MMTDESLKPAFTRLRPEQIAALDERARERRTHRAILIREAVDLFLAIERTREHTESKAA